MLTLWCNTKFNPEATRLLREGTAGHRLILSEFAKAEVLTAGQPDPALASADIALGQPAVADCLKYPGLRWIHLSTAGYTRYDTDEVREGLLARRAALSTSSGAFADPCAQHVLAMMLALGRGLLPSYREQLGERPWNYVERRYEARLLTGQTILLLGYGAIGRRLAELLAPFQCTIYAVRRQARSETAVRIVAEADLTRVLGEADHVVNVLPDNPATRQWVNARRLACCKPSARFYNVGRGTTVDQPALIEALNSGRLGAAYLDTTVPEPLPPDHPLWSAKNCFITPHIAGGRRDQDEAIVRHFLANLELFERNEPLADRVI